MKEEQVAACSLLLANRRNIAALTVADPAANQVKIKNLVEANRELTETVRALQKDAFNYFEKLLSLKGGFHGSLSNLKNARYSI